MGRLRDAGRSNAGSAVLPDTTESQPELNKLC